MENYSEGARRGEGRNDGAFTHLHKSAGQERGRAREGCTSGRRRYVQRYKYSFLPSIKHIGPSFRFHIIYSASSRGQHE